MKTAMGQTSGLQVMDHERLLIERAQAGDRHVFEELIFKYDRDILRWTVRLLGNPDEARDAYQETFLKVFRSIDQFRQESSFYAWIFRIATNVCFDRLRQRENLRQYVSMDDEGSMFFEVRLNNPFEPRAITATLNSCFGQMQLRGRINRALSTLSKKERLVFELKHYEGLRLRQISEMIGSTENTTKDCLQRAIRKLRTSLIT
jgi:RNA polymerase sigma-70 factor (ECF subfamily)